MDDDEGFILFIFAAIAVVAAGKWLFSTFRVHTFGRGVSARVVIGGVPPVCAVAACLFISAFADHEVRESGGLIALFSSGEVVVLAVMWLAMRMLGISVRDDAIERRNPAAAIAAGGVAVAGTIVYCGANIGEGPTIYTTLGPAVIAIGALLLLWFMHELIARPAESIAIERDIASAVRLSGMLIGAGLILARSVAGDWKSVEATVADFQRLAWPAAIVALVAAIVQWRSKPGKSRGILPASVYIAASLAWILTRGRP